MSPTDEWTRQLREHDLLPSQGTDSFPSKNHWSMTSFHPPSRSEGLTPAGLCVSVFPVSPPASQVHLSSLAVPVVRKDLAPSAGPRCGGRRTDSTQTPARSCSTKGSQRSTFSSLLAPHDGSGQTVIGGVYGKSFLKCHHVQVTVMGRSSYPIPLTRTVLALPQDSTETPPFL